MRQPKEAQAPTPISEIRRPLADAIDRRILDACSVPSLQLGGPSLRALGVTSAIRREGRTTVAIAMVVVQQQDYGRRPVLLEMDFDNPVLAKRLGLRAVPGLSELARGEAALDDVLQALPDKVAVITAGAASSPAARTVTDLVSSGLLADLGRRYDVVIGDLPPVLASPFGPLAADAFDQVLLVVRANVTPSRQVREAVSALRSDPVVLLNATWSRLPGWIRRLAGEG
jgi:Mrp family chromosome partitioning ATPase